MCDSRFGDKSAGSKNRKISRREWMAAAGAIGVSGIAGCSGGDSGSSNEDGTVNDDTSSNVDSITYVGWGGNTQDSVKQLFSKWSDETGIEVQHQSVGGDEEVISVLEQNPGDVDMCLTTAYGVKLARERDLLATVDFDKLPNYEDNIQDPYQNDVPYLKSGAERDTVFRDPVGNGIAYNTEQVDIDITSWNDLLDPSLGDNVARRDDAFSRFEAASLGIGSDINEVVQNESAYQETLDRMKEEHENTFQYWGSGAQAIRLLREESAYATRMWGGRVIALQNEGYDHIDYVIPEEGMPMGDENYNIPKSSNKQDAVHDLINWSFQRENAIELSNNLGYPIMLKDAPDEIRNLPDYNENVSDLLWPDYDIALQKEDQMVRDFQSVKNS